MSDYHTPKPLSAEEAVKLAAFTVDVAAGRVYKEGKEVGFESDSGYVYIGFGTKSRQRHLKRANVIWWKATGVWPTQLLDHLNLVRNDDRIENLSPKTQRANSSNSPREVDLPTGVHFTLRHESKPYMAQAYLNGKRTYLGYYSTPEEASRAYQEAINA